MADEIDPEVQRLWEGVKRELGVEPDQRKTPQPLNKPRNDGNHDKERRE